MLVACQSCLLQRGFFKQDCRPHCTSSVITGPIHLPGPVRIPMFPAHRQVETGGVQQGYDPHGHMKVEQPPPPPSPEPMDGVGSSAGGHFPIPINEFRTYNLPNQVPLPPTPSPLQSTEECLALNAGRVPMASSILPPVITGYLWECCARGARMEIVLL